MPREADFNFSDEELDDENTDDGEGTQHAGDDDEGGEGAETPDRGDAVEGEEEEGEAEGEAGAEGEGEEEGEAEGEEADPEFLKSLAAGGKTPQHVPYARLAEVVAQNQQLMQVLEGITSGRLTAAAPAAKTEEEPAAFDMKAQIKARNAALLEGDEDKAAEIDLAIEEYRTTTIRQQARQEAMQDFTAAQQKQALDTIVTEAFGKYTFLNDQSEDFNAEALDEVMMYRNHYVAKGDTLPAALAKAIEKVCPQYLDDDGEGEGEGGKPAAGKTAAGKQARDPAKVIRNAKAAKAQPPETGKAGTPNKETIDTSKLDLETMDDDKYDALPAAVKAKLRGDAVA